MKDSAFSVTRFALGLLLGSALTPVALAQTASSDG